MNADTEKRAVSTAASAAGKGRRLREMISKALQDAVR